MGVRGSRALERRMHGMARMQKGEPLRRPGAGGDGAGARVRKSGARHRPRDVSSHGQRQPVHIGQVHDTDQALGLAPSYAFVSQPETNGVVERFFRTLKEQAIYGRVFRNLAEVRQAVAEFVELYNEYWLIEKNGYRSPLQARAVHCERAAA